MTYSIGWTLVHFLWQGTVIAALLMLALHLLRKASAEVRYVTACFALCLMMLAAAGTFVRFQGPTPPVAVSGSMGNREVVAGPVFGITASPAPVDQVMPWITAAWFVGVGLLSLRWSFAWLLLGRRVRAGRAALPAGLQAVVEQLRGRLRIRREVLLRPADWLASPAVVGWLRPALLIPAGALTGLSPDQLAAVLAHELAHIRRHDYPVNLLQHAVETLLFYHPAVWWVSHRIRVERESCCDDIAVSACGSRRLYAEALVELEQARGVGSALVLAANDGSLKARVRRILHGTKESTSAWPAGAAVVALALLVLWGGQRVAARAATESRQDEPITASAPQLAAAVAEPSQSESSPPIPVHKKVSRVMTALAQAAAPSGACEKWLNEDVVYITTPEERAAFERLHTDEERNHFIEQFWLRRDPTPGTVENEFKEEHYRRIAWANERFEDNVAGWRTDRGRIYITSGPPDEIETHPAEEREIWLYHITIIDGAARDNVSLLFLKGKLITIQQVNKR